MFLLALHLAACTLAGGTTPRQWHYSSIVYGQHRAGDGGLALTRVRNAENVVYEAHKWTDFDVTVKIAVDGRILKDAFFSVGMYADVDKRYDKRSVDNGFSITFDTGKTIGFLKTAVKTAGETRVLASRDYDWTPGKEYAVRLLKQGDSVRGFVDGVEVGAAFACPKACSGKPLSLALSLHGVKITVKAVGAEWPDGSGNVGWAPLDNGMEHFGGMVGAGVRVISSELDLGEFWKAEGVYDFEVVDGNMRMMRDAAPGAKIVLRTNLRARWWNERNRQELQTVLTDDNVPVVGPGYCPQSFASKKWRDDFGEALAALVTHMEKSDYAAAVAGYHLMAGDGGEWDYGFRYMSEYSLPQKKAFRDFLLRKYGGDLGALRAAWKKPGVTFDSAELPARDARLKGDCGVFFDPAAGLCVPDFNESYSNTVVDAITHFARIVKGIVGDDKLFGVYYGYYFMPGDKAADYHNTGHHALLKLLRDKNIDFIGGPEQYYGRQHGGSWVSEAMPESIRLHGKTFLNEDDTRTCRVPELCPVFPPPYEDTLEHSIGVMLRNAGAVLTHGGSVQLWMEMGAGWFNEPALLKAVAKVSELAAENNPAPAAPEMAVVVSEDSFHYLAFSNALTYPLFTKMVMDGVAKIGAPFDTILLPDLERARDYKLYLFMNAFSLSDKERNLIKEKVMRDGKTALWFYAPGFVTAKGLSLQAIAELTGIQVAMSGKEAKLGLEMDGKTVFPAATIAPVFYSVDKTAASQGKMLSEPALPGSPGLLATRKFKDWTSIWCGVPYLPAEVLRGVAAAAGVQIYSDKNDSVYTDGRLLVVHAGGDGERLISLPGASTVTDVLTDKVVGENIKSFKTPMKLGQTGVWRVARKR